MKLALLIAVAAMSPAAFAGDVYRCQDAAGKIEFRDRPCDAGHKTRKVDVTPNSIQTMTLEEVRAKSAELKAKQRARQDADNRANADAYASPQQAWESAAQDAIDAPQAVPDQPQDYGGFYAGQQLRPPATPSPPPPPPKAPAIPTPPPKPPGSM